MILKYIFGLLLCIHVDWFKYKKSTPTYCLGKSIICKYIGLSTKILVFNKSLSYFTKKLKEDIKNTRNKKDFDLAFNLTSCTYILSFGLPWYENRRPLTDLIKMSIRSFFLIINNLFNTSPIENQNISYFKFSVIFDLRNFSQL